MPPILLSFTPETNSVNVPDKAAVFQFDEVVSERPRGFATLNLLFLVSPRSGEPYVTWHRSHISIRPRGGFRPNTVYTITMLPGLMDLHGNARKTGAVLTFSTGPSIPPTIIRGRVFDWVAGTPAPRAFVQGISRTDTNVVYVTVSDSNGAFALRHIPAGSYIVRGFIDANNNRALDRLELWDTVSVNLVDTARVELLAFLHDTIGPGITEVTISDSVTLRVTFDRGIDSTQQFIPAAFTLKGKDSVAVPVAAVQSSAAFDSEANAAARAHGDSIIRSDSLRRADSGLGGAARDTAAARQARLRVITRRDSIVQARVLRPSRRPPVRAVVVQLGAPLQPGVYYRVRAIDIHGLLGRARTTERVILMPKPTKADSAALQRGRAPAPGAPRPATPPTNGQRPPSEVPLPSPTSPPSAPPTSSPAGSPPP